MQVDVVKKLSFQILLGIMLGYVLTCDYLVLRRL